MATEPSGKAWDCNSLIIGSNPVVASSNPHLHYVNGGRFSLRYIKKETKIGEGISGYF